VVETSHSVRDIYAILGRGADHPVQVRLNVDGEPYCSLTFATGMIVSDSVEGVTLPPLTAGAMVTLSVLAVGQYYP
jgi:hypothetical protein